MEVLQGSHLERVHARVGHACCCSARGRESREARHFVDDRGSADMRAVGAWTQAARRVDHELHLPLRDQFNRVRSHTLLSDLGHQRVHDEAG